MAENHQFRNSLNGFNKEDVVRYLDYLNAKHDSECNQLKSEIQSLKKELSALSIQISQAALASESANEVNKRYSDLEAENQRLLSALEEAKKTRPAPAIDSSLELEAYRRAERAERLAQERAAQLYQQAHGIIADITAKADEAVANIAHASDVFNTQLSELQDTVTSNKQSLQSAAAALYCVCPSSDKE